MLYPVTADLPGLSLANRGVKNRAEAAKAAGPRALEPAASFRVPQPTHNVA